MPPQHTIVESTRRLPKGQRHEGLRKMIIGNKVRNWMVSTSVCTLVKGDGKVKITWRGLRNGHYGWRDDGRVGG